MQCRWLSYTARIRANLFKPRPDNDHFCAAKMTGFVNSHAAAWVGLGLAALMSMLYAAWFAQRPLYNWDIIPYVAVALLDAGQPADSVRQKTYEIVERSTPPDAHDFLVWRLGVQEGQVQPRRRLPLYGQRMTQKYLPIQLPFYTVKPAYPALVSVLVRAGVNPVTGTMIRFRHWLCRSLLSILCLDFAVGQSRGQPNCNWPAFTQSSSYPARATRYSGLLIRLYAFAGNLSCD